MARVLFLKGLPASGKSTFAKKLAKDPQWKRINKDELREMLDNSIHSNSNEAFVLKVRDLLVELALQNNKNVVVDDTNFAPKHETKLREIAEIYKAEFNIQLIDTDYQECIKRDAARAKPVGENVIRKMYTQYVKQPIELIPFIKGLPDAIMVDIDGTLAHSDQRSPYDPSLYHLDSFDNTIADIVKHYRNAGFKIIVCSGRDDDFRKSTSDWLISNEFTYDHLFMRRTGDRRNDAIIKVELFDEFIFGKFNVHFVLDDRDRVVDAWRKRGLRCLQVASGDF